MTRAADDTLGALKAQRDELDRQINEMKDKLRSEALRDAREKIALFDLTPAELGLAGRGRPAKVQQPARASVAPKYRDPESGATWSGRGKPPKWIAGQDDRSRFTI